MTLPEVIQEIHRLSKMVANPENTPITLDRHTLMTSNYKQMPDGTYRRKNKY